MLSADQKLIAIQYAKAMGLRVIGIDINDAQLQSAQSLGADLTVNSRTELDYVDKIKVKTNGGAHAAVVFSAAKVAYDHAPAILR
jgi:D-arabinose 1-dehydrogenase-like Zn-dependent alcohol dehydrogenase